MLEQLKTTGSRTRVAQLPSSFNAAVGGDRIENVLYRLDDGLFTLLSNRGIQVWVLSIGGNHVGGKKKALRGEELWNFGVLLEALLRIEPMSRVLVCEPFQRMDVDDDSLQRMSESLKVRVDRVNERVAQELEGPGRIMWVERPMEIKKDVHLADHLHLNAEGYRLWDEILYPKILELLE